MQEQKKYHQRKLAIIEMIEECDRQLEFNSRYFNKFKYSQIAFNNAVENKQKYENIKQRLTKWLSE